MNKIRVWLASNSESCPARPRLTGDSALEWIGQSDLSGDALTRIEATQPQVLVLGTDSHDRRLNRILKRLTSALPATRIIVYSQSQDKRFVMRLLRQGVHGYLSKVELDTELTHAIQIVMQGNVFLCPSASGALVREYRKRARARKQNVSLSPSLNRIITGKAE